MEKPKKTLAEQSLEAVNRRITELEAKRAQAQRSASRAPVEHTLRDADPLLVRPEDLIPPEPVRPVPSQTLEDQSSPEVLWTDEEEMRLIELERKVEAISRREDKIEEERRIEIDKIDELVAEREDYREGRLGQMNEETARDLAQYPSYYLGSIDLDSLPQDRRLRIQTAQSKIHEINDKYYGIKQIQGLDNSVTTPLHKERRNLLDKRREIKQEPFYAWYDAKNLSDIGQTSVSYLEDRLGVSHPVAVKLHEELAIRQREMEAEALPTPVAQSAPVRGPIVVPHMVPAVPTAGPIVLGGESSDELIAMANKRTEELSTEWDEKMSNPFKALYYWKRVGQIQKEVKELERQKIEEDRKIHPFRHYLISRMTGLLNEKILFGEEKTLRSINEVMGEDEQVVETWRSFKITKKRDYAVRFSSNGFYMRLINIKHVSDRKNGVRTMDLEARYELVKPDGTPFSDVFDYSGANRALEEEAARYQEEKLREFEGRAPLPPLPPIPPFAPLPTPSAPIPPTPAGGPVIPPTPVRGPVRPRRKIVTKKRVIKAGAGAAVLAGALSVYQNTDTIRHMYKDVKDAFSSPAKPRPARTAEYQPSAETTSTPQNLQSEAEPRAEVPPPFVVPPPDVQPPAPESTPNTTTTPAAETPAPTPEPIPSPQPIIEQANEQERSRRQAQAQEVAAARENVEKSYHENLTEAETKEAADIFAEAIKKIFPGAKMAMWQDVQNWPARNVFYQRGKPQVPVDPFSYYMFKLREITGLEPGGTMMQPEPTGAYMERTLLAIAHGGELEKIKAFVNNNFQ